MKIKIVYSSKWSVELMDELRLQKVNSLGNLKDNNKKDLNFDYNDDYEAIMKKISNTYYNFTYKTITKNTVLGILARLVGEIRYLDIALKEPNHIINKIKDRIDFKLEDRVLYNEIVSLYKKPTEVQSNGGGLIYNKSKNNLLLSKNSWSEIIYALFNLKSLNEIDSFINAIINMNNKQSIKQYIINNNLAYKKEITVHNFISEHDTHSKIFSSIDKEYVKEKKLKNNNYQYSQEVQVYHNILTKIAKYTQRNLDINNEYNAYANLGAHNEKNTSAVLNIIGLLYYFIVEWANKNGYSNEIDNNKLINGNKNIPGIATNSGKMTIKDLYGAISPKKLSWSMPYMLETKMMKKINAPQINQSNTNIGIGKESGVLTITINVSEQEARELKDIINYVAVATFSVGKKGLAYVQEIDIYE
jgi:hypothetical protein